MGGWGKWDGGWKGMINEENVKTYTRPGNSYGTPVTTEDGSLEKRSEKKDRKQTTKQGLDICFFSVLVFQFSDILT